MAGGFARRWHCSTPKSQPGPNLGSATDTRLHREKHGQQVKGGDSVPPLCFCETLPECCVRLWGSQHKKNVDLQEQVLMFRGLKTG